MLLSVKQGTLAAVVWSLFSFAGPARAADARYAFVAPGLSVSLQQPFYQAMSQSALWRLPLKAEQIQVLRLENWQLAEQRPFYWSQTRLDQRSLQLMLQVRLEVWDGPELRWQSSSQQVRQLRLMGPELRGSGLALMSQLAQLPEGALIRTGPDRQRIADLEQQLLEAASFALLQDYHRHNAGETTR
ncbi:MAG: hypothetical protein ACO1RX_13885 [Candidatus Sericytochromatia bacterium]